MIKFNTREEAFASQNYDPTAVKIEGVPAHHVEALKRMANILVAHDAVNPDFQPDFSDYNQNKYTLYYEPGSPSGRGFSLLDVAYWLSDSFVGARLVSENGNAARHIDELCHEDFKVFMSYERPSAKK